jgi:tetratricopeptide (TPR) repeat protein
MSYASAVVTFAAALWLMVFPSSAGAQVSTLDAIRELVASEGSAHALAPGELRGRHAAAIARIAASLEEWDRNIDALERRIAVELRDATSERAFQLRVELGLAYRQRGRFADAVREFDAAAAVRPGASDVHLLRALTLDAAGHADAAGQAFRTAWLRDMANPIKAYLALAPESDLSTGERERARKVLRDAFGRTLTSTQVQPAQFPILAVVPDNLSPAPVVGDATVAGLFARLADGRFDDALTVIGKMSATNPVAVNDASPLAQFERARADELHGRPAEARRAYGVALTGTLTGRHVLYVGIGRLAQVDGDLDEAIEAFQQAVRLNPNEPVIRRELAGALAAAGRIDEAFAELAAALLVDPRNVDVMTAVGQLFLDANRSADAVGVLRRAVELAPERRHVHYALAVALSRAGRTGDAEREFDIFERMSRDALDERRREVNGHAGPTTGPRE